jgi:hypothetical protein
MESEESDYMREERVWVGVGRDILTQPGLSYTGHGVIGERWILGSKLPDMRQAAGSQSADRRRSASTLGNLKAVPIQWFPPSKSGPNLGSYLFLSFPLVYNV